MDWLGLISLVIVLALPVALFAGRKWITAWIERSVQQRFDERIESLRSELRKQEQTFKSDLRSNETKISALREGVLSGRANRQALLEKRRIKAVERVWAAVIALAPYKNVARSMASINFEEAAKRTPNDAKLRMFFEVIGKQLPDPQMPQQPAGNEQPFLSPLAWAYFSAYVAVLGSAFAKLKLLELGVPNAGELLNRTYVQDLLKTTLPHQTEFIEKSDAYYYLLDELEAKLLNELRKMLEGADIDEASIARSAEIMKAVEKVTKDSEKQMAKGAGTDAERIA